VTDQRVDAAACAVVGADEVLTSAALDFVADLQRRFRPRRDELMQRRQERYAETARTGRLDFLDETADVRAAEWTVAEAPADLRDRRVEITGPTEPKMAINALNSGAKVWLADLEDANTPHWANVVEGQVVLRAATRRELRHTSAEGRDYQLRSDQPLAVMLVRPRGWHLDERHVSVDGAASVGALVDFGLHMFHNASELIERGSGPYFYLPKMESHLEARLWADVFRHAEQVLGIEPGRVRATVLIETIPAAFEMEEILYELREYASGLNAGRWDYLFSIIKNFRSQGAAFVLPDRNQVTMSAPFMRAYTELLVTTCHRRGAFAIGGMAAFIPSRRDAAVNELALAKVRQDKQREAGDGFDGSWVAHPDLVPVCREVFDEVLGDQPNQLQRRREHVSVTSEQLLDIAATPGTVTEEGLRNDIAVALRYLGEWLGGTGAVAISNLMEDAATAEIARSQVWQWLHNGVVLDTGEAVSRELVNQIADEELDRVRAERGDADAQLHRYDQARELFVTLAVDDDYADFLTVVAYGRLD
jgi:malate synthase